MAAPAPLGATYGGQTGATHGGNTGALYGGDETPERGWRVALFEPHATGPERQLSDALLSVDFGFEHTAASDVRIEVPPFEGLTANRYVGGRLHVYYDGRLLFRADIDTHDEADDGTLTMGGVGTPSARLRGGEIGRSFDDILTHEATADVFESKEFTTRVHAPLTERVKNRTAQEARSASGFSQILTHRPRDPETGQFTSGSVSVIAPTTPLAIERAGLTQCQTNRVIEAEHWDERTAVRREDAPDASNGVEVPLTASGDHLRYRFAFEYTVPGGHLRVALRLRRTDGQTARATLYLRLNGSVIGRIPTERVGPGYQWVHVRAPPDDLSPDSHDLEIDVDGGDPDVSLDVLSIYDDRFSYFFDNSVGADGALDGPELYPKTQRIAFDAPAIGMGVSEARAAAEWDQHSPGQGVGVAAGSQRTERDGSDTTAQAVLSTSATTTRVHGFVSLGRYDATNRRRTPRYGSESQVLESYLLRVSGELISIIDSRTEEGTPESVLQSLCEFGDLRYVIQPPSQDPEQPARVEVFETADPRLRRPLPGRRVVTSVDESVKRGDYANVVEVEGAEIPRRPGQHYRATVRAPEEIQALRSPPADNGVRSVKLIDRGLTTDNDCRSKARTELNSRLASDDVGGSVETLPAIVLPGYPYRTPFFAESGEGAGYGYNYGYNYGTVPAGKYSSLETSSFAESAGDVSTGLEFERVPGLAGLLARQLSNQGASAD